MTRTKMVIGVDVGQKGGLACLVDYQFVDGMRMPTTEIRGKTVSDASAIMAWVLKLEEQHGPFHDRITFGVEAVHAMPKQGVSSTFQFGRNLGVIDAVVSMSNCPTHYVTPAVWKKAYNLSSNKQASIDAAKLRFGEAIDPYLRFKADDGIAEAALIAAYVSEKFT